MARRYQLAIQEADGAPGAVFDVGAEPLRIGRDATNDIILPSPFVSRFHASVVLEDARRLMLRAEGLNPTIVNEREIKPGDSTELRAGDSIVVQGFVLKVQVPDAAPPVTDADGRARFTALVTALHEAVINRLDPRVVRLDSIKSDEGRLAALRVLREELEFLPLDDAPTVGYAGGEALRTAILLSLLGQSGGFDSEPFGRPDRYADAEQMRAWLMSRICDTLHLDRRHGDPKANLRQLREGFAKAYATWRGHITPDVAEHLTRWLLRKEVADLIFGLGPLTDLVRMPDISEIMVVSKDQIYIEQGGSLEETGKTFVSDRVSEQILERILGPINRRVDRSSPMVDARLADGSRVNAVIPPLAIKGPCITIRRFSRDPLTIDDLVSFGAISAQVATFLRACVKGRKNIVISGGTGSGKTTLLNALSGWIPAGERVVTIEDTAELRLQQRHVVTLEAKPPNVENRGEVTIRDLLRNALRMRPDRIIVGECRGKEALDMLQAMNTGHEGSMTTGHANSPADMLQRLEVMVLEAADLPLSAVRRQIVSGIDLIVQQTRLRDGRRRVTAVTEVIGIDDMSGDVVTEDIFTYGESGLTFTGYLPAFADALTRDSHLDPAEVFWGD
jgi:Flp pilus assembly CpaF family ATPase